MENTKRSCFEIQETFFVFSHKENLPHYNKINYVHIIKIYPKRVTEEIHKISNYSHIHLRDTTQSRENFNYHSTHLSKFIVGTSIRCIVIAYKQAKTFLQFHNEIIITIVSYFILAHSLNKKNNR